MRREPWRERYLVFGAPDIRRTEYDEVLACLDSRWIGTGPRVTRLEEEFRAYVGAAAVAAVNSGSAALQLALKVLDLPPAAEIITSTMTFCATANAIVHAGCAPVLVDCDRLTMNIDVEAAARVVTPRTRAILPVHFAGLPCDMQAVLALARAHGLSVIEDCAHAIEATIDGQHCGTFGDLGCFSFYVTKNMTTVEGGMVACRDQALADRVAVLALHGMTKDARYRYRDDGYVHYDVHEPGYKHNLTDLAASLGLHQLARIDESWERRRQLWVYYRKALRDLPLILPPEPPSNVRHALHLFTCLVDDSATGMTRDEVLRELHRLRIGCGVHYRAVHLLDYYRRTLPATAAFPNAEWISDRTFSIPLSPAVTDEDAADVVEALHTVLA
jgi:dTDP-4-amino-4,6-dideoxygalactose transaminase